MILLKKNRPLAHLSFTDLVTSLQARLQEPLPGLDAQLRMTSSIRLREMMNFSTPGNATPSSVLLLLYPDGNEPMTVFMQRPEYDGVHSGQISLPGGKAEATDPDPEYTALREAHEEIGIRPGTVRILGKLTDLYIPPSNFIVSPYIGWCPERPSFTIDPSEVSKIVEVRIADLLSEKNIREERFRVRNDFVITAPAYVINGEIIWGATAMMVAEFCEVVRSLAERITR